MRLYGSEAGISLRCYSLANAARSPPLTRRRSCLTSLFDSNSPLPFTASKSSRAIARISTTGLYPSRSLPSLTFSISDQSGAALPSDRQSTIALVNPSSLEMHCKQFWISGRGWSRAHPRSSHTVTGKQRHSRNG